jgi:hypothetical protein
MSERGFFSRILGGGADEDDTRIYSDEEIEGSHRSRSEPEEAQRPHGFTVERAAEIIDDLPPEVPRESAVRIVRGTLAAAGIRMEDLDRSTQAREAKLNSEIDLARNRQEELRQRTEELVRSLEQEIKRAREDRDNGVAEEEEKISRASAGIEGVKRVRDFFGFLGPEEEEIPSPAEDASVDETQVLKPFDADETQVLGRSGQLADAEEPTDAATSERLSRYRDPRGTHDQP